jgi:hypothetical protein
VPIKLYVNNNPCRPVPSRTPKELTELTFPLLSEMNFSRLI